MHTFIPGSVHCKLQSLSLYPSRSSRAEQTRQSLLCLSGTAFNKPLRHRQESSQKGREEGRDASARMELQFILPRVQATGHGQRRWCKDATFTHRNGHESDKVLPRFDYDALMLLRNSYAKMPYDNPVSAFSFTWMPPEEMD